MLIGLCRGSSALGHRTDCIPGCALRRHLKGPYSFYYAPRIGFDRVDLETTLFRICGGGHVIHCSRFLATIRHDDRPALASVREHTVAHNSRIADDPPLDMLMRRTRLMAPLPATMSGSCGTPRRRASRRQRYPFPCLPNSPLPHSCDTSRRYDASEVEPSRETP
jgi:hypothetical protein